MTLSLVWALSLVCTALQIRAANILVKLFCDKLVLRSSVTQSDIGVSGVHANSDITTKTNGV